MSSFPKVTVIVPSYNHEQYVTQCIESIMNQTYKNIDLTVIDDGSTDNSVQILKDLNLKYGFKLVLQKNRGVVSTLNDALMNNELGKYVCLPASDDYWPLDKVERQVKFMEENPDCYLSYGDYVEINSKGEILENVRCRPPKNNFFQELMLSNYVPGPTFMLRSKAFETVGYYDPNYRIEDWYMWLKVMKAFPHAGYIPANLGYYRLHASNFSKNIDIMTNESIKILDQYKNEPVYEQALAIVHAKRIVKHFFQSIPKGLGLLFTDFKFRYLTAIIAVFIAGQGPFRKIKFSYWNFGGTK